MNRVWLLVAGLLMAVNAHADTGATVEALQMPAWVVRAGQRAPLSVGAALRNDDQIETGAGSRVLLRMPEGSSVKLGEQARLRMAGMQRRARRDGVFTAALSMLAGAFRFTTGAVDPYKGKRQIDVRFRTATLGIRGTDVWGKSAPDRDIVVLIEGRIQVERRGEPPLTMATAKTVYQAPHGARALPVTQIDPEQLARWAAETELQPGSGVIRRGGRWRVYLSPSTTRPPVAAISKRLGDAGYSAEVRRAQDAGARNWVVDIGSLADRTDAVAVADKLKTEFGIAHSTVATE